MDALQAKANGVASNSAKAAQQSLLKPASPSPGSLQSGAAHTPPASKARCAPLMSATPVLLKAPNQRGALSHIRVDTCAASHYLLPLRVLQQLASALVMLWQYFEMSRCMRHCRCMAASAVQLSSSSSCAQPVPCWKGLANILCKKRHRSHRLFTHGSWHG